MKRRLLIRILMMASVLLVCGSVGWFFMSRLGKAEERASVSLYALIPSEAEAVLAIDDVEVFGQACRAFMPFVGETSDVMLYEAFTRWASDPAREGGAGSFRRQGGCRVLVSFHASPAERGEVFYCHTGEGGVERASRFLRSLSVSSFPVKTLDCRGEQIQVYPLADGRFLAAYAGQGFLAVSFQSRLLEEVVKARQDSTGLATRSTLFREADVPHGQVASLYLHADSVSMGEGEAAGVYTLHVGGWIRFGIRFRDGDCWLSGETDDAEAGTWLHAMGRQEAFACGPEAERYPRTTFALSRWGFSMPDTLAAFALASQDGDVQADAYALRRDAEWLAFLRRYAGKEAYVCLFRPEGRGDTVPCLVAGVPLHDEWAARRYFRAWHRSVPADPHRANPKPWSPRFDRYPKARPYTQYRLPRATLPYQLWRIECGGEARAAFYRGTLLMAPDGRSLSAYIDAMERGHVLIPDSLVGSEGLDLWPSECVLYASAEVDSLGWWPHSALHCLPSWLLARKNGLKGCVITLMLAADGDGRYYPSVRVRRSGLQLP